MKLSPLAFACAGVFVCFLLSSSTTEAINFKQWKDCKSCTDAGYGWCPIRRMCGGFANRNCRGDHTDTVKSDEELEDEAEEERRRLAAENADSDVIALTDANFHDELAKHPAALVEFYAPWCGHCKALKPAYDEAAAMLKKENSKAVLVKVDATANREVAQENNVNGFPTIKLFRDGEFETDYDGGRDVYDIVEYMRNAAKEASKPRPKLPRVVSFNMQIANSLLKHKVKRQLMVFADKKTLASMQAELDKAGEILENDGPNMLILTLNTKDSSLSPVINRFEVERRAKGPIYRVADSSGAGGLQALRPSHFDDQNPLYEPNADGFVKLCNDFMDKKFGRVLRSASSTPSPLAGKAAKELIGKNFVKNVLGDDKNDAVVFFYMPGCGHCKKLLPHYKKVASFMPIDNPNVNFFTIDGTKNEVESSPVAGYPTVYFYPAGDKRNPEMISARDPKGLRRFIAGKATDFSNDNSKSEL